VKIIAGTSVWSLALRKKTLTEVENNIVKELIYELRVVLFGPFRQELL
jgi:hypothetical protein